MSNPLINPNFWKDDLGNRPPRFWNGTSYVSSDDGSFMDLVGYTPVTGDVLTGNWSATNTSAYGVLVAQGGEGAIMNNTLGQSQVDCTATPTSYTYDIPQGQPDPMHIKFNLPVAGSITLTPTLVVTASNESASLPENSVGNLLPYAIQENGSGVTPDSLAITTAPSNGTASIVGKTILYTPKPNFAGIDSLQYTGTVSSVTSAPATITITVIQASPEVRLRWSDDGGHHWSNAQSACAGNIGQTAQRVLFRRIGSTRRNTGLDRIFEISSDMYSQAALIGAYLGDD